jgi:hypothetical protein
MTAAQRSESVEAPARVEYGDRVQQGAKVRVVVRAEAQRVRRAILGGLTCWGLAVLSVFVPLGHFILVPSLLIAGPVIFFMRLAEGVSLEAAHGQCPMCGCEQDFSERGRLFARHPVRCSTCGRELDLVAELPGLAQPQPSRAMDSSQQPRVWLSKDARRSGEAPPAKPGG